MVARDILQRFPHDRRQPHAGLELAEEYVARAISGRQPMPGGRLSCSQLPVTCRRPRAKRNVPQIRRKSTVPATGEDFTLVLPVFSAAVMDLFPAQFASLTFSARHQPKAF